MEFSSLVLMERDKETNFLIKELGSYEVSEGALYVTKFYYDGDKVNMFFDTNRDVEEWEYSAIYDLFNLDAFEEAGFIIEEVDNEYNPTWLLKFDYMEEYKDMGEKINTACELIEDEMESVFEAIKAKEDNYK
ncbi:hypothetical protein JK636_12935 [Clostridium sp. YIM B02515]|uniref:DUF1292 domain-containing protein n=1 Tax=Clostridium rhizosphaerae TaxID=2803861 RepID=A0ABS1TBC4_9CLOT|nr:DUF6762 family protein [Clostridium rhizosphaerae]MBL4936661.1 hypothetical protein [Clostridium rhizosphaerae]